LEEDKMEKKTLRNGLAIGTILMFIGISIVPGMGGVDNPVSRVAVRGNEDCGCNVHDVIEGNKKETLLVEYPVMSNPLYINCSNSDTDFSHLTVLDTPNEFSWSNNDGKDYTTPAKNQGNCGSCWDFAEIGALESVIEIREECAELNPDLSEQYVLSCLPQAGSCRGRREGAFYYIMNSSADGNYHNGVIPESCFRYQANDDIRCSEKCLNWENYLVSISDFGESWIGLDSSINREILKSQIMLYGPVSAGINVSRHFSIWGSLHHEPTDYFPYVEEEFANWLNHLIVIVGWKDDSSIGRGGYWICKNSWGTDWGYDGFFNIEYGGLFTGIWIEWVDYNPNSFDWPPVAEAGGLYQGDVGQAIKFDASRSVDAEGEIVSYYWDFGDGAYGTGVSSSHEYSQPGVYKVTLTVTDSDNKTSSDTTTVGIEESPIPIDISGGKGITVVVTNPFEDELTNLEWSIELNGVIFTYKPRNGIIPLIPANSEFKYEIPLIGIGPGAITITIANVSKTVNFFIIGPFVLMR
jgi:hypothetical protein